MKKKALTLPFFALERPILDVAIFFELQQRNAACFTICFHHVGVVVHKVVARTSNSRVQLIILKTFANCCLGQFCGLVLS